MTGPDLRAWREARGLSRRAASDVLGVNERTMLALENGERSGETLLPVLERLTAALKRLGE